jgi:hypothetical protein
LIEIKKYNHIFYSVIEIIQKVFLYELYFLGIKIRWMMDHLRSLNVLGNIRFIKTASQYESSSTSLVLVSIVRDAEHYIESFVDYYLSLGCIHIVILDNSSEDKTVEKLLKYKQVTVLSTSLPFKTYKRPLKKYLYDKYSIGCWCLIADVDEYFDYPYSDCISLSQFLNYLNENQYSAVAAHMLDMFSDSSIDNWPNPANEYLPEKCKWYDISHITKNEYHDENGKLSIIRKNYFSNTGLKIYRGGVRKRFFNINAWLTKHPLMYRDRGACISMYSEHACVDANIADINCVLLHYKFDSEFISRASLAVQRKNYWNNSIHYKKYLEKINNNEFTMKLESSRQLENMNQLIDDDFIEITKEYIDYIKRVSSVN